MKNIILAVLICLGLGTCNAQVGPAATGGTTTISAGGAAVAFHYQGNWTVGTLLPQSFDIKDWGAQKGNSFSVEVIELIAPAAAGFNSYLVGGRYSPDISSFVNHSNLSGDQFRVFVRGAGGETTLVGGAKGTGMFGGGVSYMITPNLTWTTIEGYGVYFNGQWTPGVSAGIAYVFNGQQSPSFAVKRMVAKAARKAAAVRDVR